MNKNQKGFGIVETLLILILVGLLGGVGWYVYDSNKKADDSLTNASNSTDAYPGAKKNPAASDVYKGWKTYDKNGTYFRYPADWSVNYDSENPTGVVTVKSPVDKEIKLVEFGTEKTSNPRLELSVVPKPSFETSSHACADTCTVYDVQQINNPSLTNEKLVISDFNGGLGSPIMFSVVDDPAVKVGSKDYIVGFTMNGQIRVVEANVQYNVDNDKTQRSFGAIDNLSDFKKTNTYRDMVKIMESVRIN